MLDTLRQNEEIMCLYTAKEEYAPMLLDRLGRFPYYMSKRRNTLDPEVSRFLIEKGLRFEYPENRKFAVCLTHDIDAVYLPKLDLMYDSKLGMMYRAVRSRKARL